MHYNTKPTNNLNRSIINYISNRYGIAFRNQSVGIYNKFAGVYTRPSMPRGLPDIFAIIKGKAIGIETKKFKEQLSDHQKEWRDKIVHKGGGLHWVIHNMEELYIKLNLHFHEQQQQR